MSQLPGVKEVGKLTGLSGRPLGVALIIGGAAAILVSAPVDASIIGLPLGIILDLLGVFAIVTGLIMVVKG